MSRSRIIDLANFPQFTAINVLSDPGRIAGPVVIPNCCKFMIVWQLPDGKIGRNVLGMSVGAAFNPTPALAEAGRAALVSGTNWTALAALLTGNLSLLRVELQDIRAPNLPAVASTGSATPGTAGGSALPSEVAAVLSIKTALTGQQNRGRAYIPGWAAAANTTGDIMTAAAVNAVTNFGSNIQAGIVAAGGTWVILKPARAAYTGSTGTAHPARGATSQPVTTFLCRDNHWDSQRRRGLK